MRFFVRFQSIVTSPVTNHVCKYFSPLEVKYNDRFSWKAKHFADYRNYAELHLSFGPQGCSMKVDMKLFEAPEYHEDD